MYFALAASRLAPVRVLGITGADTAAAYQALFAPFPIDTAGMVVSETPTFVWHAVHDFERWVAASESSEPGCDPEWSPVLQPAERAAEVLFLASMHPRLQLAVRRQSAARLVACDSMTTFMDSDPAAVRAVVESSHIVFLNRAELQALTGLRSWQEAARSLLGQGTVRAVVVKAGPAGAAVVSETTVIEEAATPVPAVVDPTGAGDALAGGFLGRCAADQRDDDGIFAAALDDGVRTAAAAITSFGVHDLLRFAGASGSRAV